MKKLLFLTLTIGSLISCKDDKKDDVVEDGNYTWNYEGYFGEKSSYVHANADSAWMVNKDDTSFNHTFHIKGINNNNTLTRVLDDGQSYIIKENFQFDSENSYTETSGGGSSHYSLSIKIDGDSLFVLERRASGIANLFSSFIRARRTN